MIIGLTGFARSGKDSVAKVLVEHYGFTRVAFADKIKDLLVEMDPILENGHHLSSMLEDYGWELTKAKPEVRRLLQSLGVGARKIFGDNHWVVEATKNLDRTANYVITDVRFINEAVWVKDVFGGPIWRVERPGVGPINNHVSENELNDYPVDCIFINNGALEDLEAMIKARMVGLLV
jgi:hypothetical protein